MQLVFHIHLIDEQPASLAGPSKLPREKSAHAEPQNDPPPATPGLSSVQIAATGNDRSGLLTPESSVQILHSRVIRRYTTKRPRKDVLAPEPQKHLRFADIGQSPNTKGLSSEIPFSPEVQVITDSVPADPDDPQETDQPVADFELIDIEETFGLPWLKTRISANDMEDSLSTRHAFLPPGIKCIIECKCAIWLSADYGV
jgi:hypothetical protein